MSANPSISPHLIGLPDSGYAVQYTPKEDSICRIISGTNDVLVLDLAGRQLDWCGLPEPLRWADEQRLRDYFLSQPEGMP